MHKMTIKLYILFLFSQVPLWIPDYGVLLADGTVLPDCVPSSLEVRGDAHNHDPHSCKREVMVDPCTACCRTTSASVTSRHNVSTVSVQLWQQQQQQQWQVCLCVCVYMHVYVCACACVCQYLCVCVCAYRHVYVCACVCVCQYLCVCVYVLLVHTFSLC